jgi:hypothetical protein
LLRFAGIGCIAVGAVWEVVAAVQGGFPASLLWDRFDPDRTSRSHRDLLGGHWEDLKGPFYLIVFGAALLASAQRLLPQLPP